MENRVLKGLDIEIFNLQNKEYRYEFEIDPTFFEKFNESLIEKGNAAIEVVLNKQETFLTLKLSINGAINLICDRSLEEFEYPISILQEVIFKYGEEEVELDEYMYQITKNTERINLGQLVYEFLNLSVPMKKLHPKFKNEEEDNEEVTFFYSSTMDGEKPIQAADQEDNKTIDPRWQKLKDLRNNKL